MCVYCDGLCCPQYLRSVRPLLEDAEYERMVKLAEEFRATLGPRLQRYLWLKSW